MTSTRILVVDDEEMVLTATARMLQMVGFDVHQASSGEGALDILSSSASQIDLVVTDVNMPELSGIDLAHAIACTWDTIAVLLVSGKEPAHEVLKGLPSHFRFLRKPYGIDTLTAAVESVLDTKLSRGPTHGLARAPSPSLG